MGLRWVARHHRVIYHIPAAWALLVDVEDEIIPARGPETEVEVLSSTVGRRHGGREEE